MKVWGDLNQANQGWSSFRTRKNGKKKVLKTQNWRRGGEKKRESDQPTEEKLSRSGDRRGSEVTTTGAEMEEKPPNTSDDAKG